MVDEVDEAQEIEQRERETALARHASRRADRGSGVSSTPADLAGGGAPGDRRRRRLLHRDCSRCALPIDPRRLKVHPKATTCIDCQRKLEREE